MYTPRRRRRRGLSLAVMGLMMGASLLLPMLMGKGSNPLAMFGLGGKKGGEEPKATAATTTSRSSVGSRKAPLVLEVPRITAQRPASTGPAAPRASVPRRAVSAPAAPVSSLAPPAPAAPKAAGRVAAAAAAPPTFDLVTLKRERDAAYVELRSALKSGDPTRVQRASVVYSTAERTLRDARN